MKPKLFALFAIASLCGMFAGDVFAAGPTSATAIDVKGAETIPGGRVVLTMNDGWEFKWGKDKSAGEWTTVDLPHDAQFEQPWTQKDSSGARGFKPMGEMWYRRIVQGSELKAQGSEGKRVFLEFGGLLCVGDSIRTAGEAVALTAEVEGGDFAADGQDLIYVRCRIVDANGTQVRRARNKVSFSCEGAAKFLACDNGDHYTDELFTSDITAKNAKDGFILAAFRTRTIPGEAKITIRPEGLPVVSLTVPVGRAEDSRLVRLQRADERARPDEDPRG